MYKPRLTLPLQSGKLAHILLMKFPPIYPLFNTEITNRSMRFGMSFRRLRVASCVFSKCKPDQSIKKEYLTDSLKF